MSTVPTGVAALPGIAAAAEAGAAEAAAAGPAAAAVAAATEAVAGVAAAGAAGAAAAAEAAAAATAAAAAAAAAGVEAAAQERSAGVTVAAIAVDRGAITEVITTPPPKPLATRPEARSQLHNMQPLRKWRRPDRNHGTRKLGIQHPQTWYLCSSGGPSPCSGGQQPCPYHQRCPATKG